MTSGFDEPVGQRVEIVGHLAVGHGLIPGRQRRVVVVRQVVEHLRVLDGALRPLVRDVQDQGDAPRGHRRDRLGDLALAGVGDQVEPRGRPQDPEAVDAPPDLEVHQARERLQIDRLVGVERGGHGRDDAVQSRTFHRRGPRGAVSCEPTRWGREPICLPVCRTSRPESKESHEVFAATFRGFSAGDGSRRRALRRARPGPDAGWHPGQLRGRSGFG